MIGLAIALVVAGVLVGPPLIALWRRSTAEPTCSWCDLDDLLDEPPETSLFND